MCIARDAIATTSFVVDTDNANGFSGSDIVTGDHDEPSLGCMCSVESQAADITRPCSLLWATALAPCWCVLRTCCNPEVASNLRTSQSSPAEYSTSSVPPKHTSRTGARCS